MPEDHAIDRDPPGTGSLQKRPQRMLGGRLPRPALQCRSGLTRAEASRAVLSARELEVLHLLADGASNPDIGKKLYISRRTAEHHVEHILAKLEVTSRTAAVAYALTHELLS
jgi:DNA-binding NarL/FixJ family response regulator